ncbi:DUF2339 domain-containing protein [soil metagenome]
MTQYSNRIDQLLEKLETLLSKQENFQKEVYEIRKEIYTLKAKDVQQNLHQEFREQVVPDIEKEEPEIASEIIVAEVSETPISLATAEPILPQKPFVMPRGYSSTPNKKSDLEKFIGENLINKIGIVITVLGVSIGAKYSIEHDLISPLTRIILGYLIGLGLMGFGIRLKKNYLDLSAVLVSGSMAILYFLTFAAYRFYQLIPLPLTFGMMLVFTIFTVIAALNYNRQIIAHFGLVGAYAVPFLLSDGSGKPEVLFSYMVMINLGILFIAFKKYWKPLYFVSFGLTWLIYSFWHVSAGQGVSHFTMAFTFLCIFFFIFYALFLAFKLIQKKQFEKSDILLLLANSFIFYGNGYNLLDSLLGGGEWLGLFTLVNAIIHFGVSSIIYRQKLADKNLFYLVAGLVLVFITIAIPVQLSGNWVTLLWAGEAALLFTIGRRKQIPVYEKLSYPVMILAFGSIITDWLQLSDIYNYVKISTAYVPVLNIHFLMGILFCGAFLFINLQQNKSEFKPAFLEGTLSNRLMNVLIPGILLITLYFTIFNEITYFYSQLYMGSEITIMSLVEHYDITYYNNDFTLYKTVWYLNYSLLFFGVLCLINLKKIRKISFGKFIFIVSMFTLFIFHNAGLYALSELRESYLNHVQEEYYPRSNFNILIRYISYLFCAFILYTIYCYYKDELSKSLALLNQKFIDILLSVSLLWILSSELLNWMDIAGSSSSYKLGLSIFWGIYSLTLISLGIGKNKKHLRVGAFVLFGVTLVKLFLYDIASLNTIAKTIVFVSLGILLLIISFLYNKYKHLITKENEG